MCLCSSLLLQLIVITYVTALTQVLSRVTKGIITSISDFHRDMTLIFDNCRLYNVQACFHPRCSRVNDE